MKLSIVTVNLNNASGLLKTIESFKCALKKTNFIEWIVIDGGSCDSSLIDLKKYDAYNYKLLSEKDNGIYEAMNKGIDMASGEYIIFMNSGDCFYNINDIISRISQWTEDLIYGDYSIRNDKNLIEITKQTKVLDFPFLLGKTINHQSFFLKTLLVKKYKFDIRFSIVADWVQLFQIFKNEDITYQYLGIPISIYDTNGISSNSEIERQQQRKEYLSLYYSRWELNSLDLFVKMRQRVWYAFVIKSLSSYRRSIILNWLSNLLR